MTCSLPNEIVFQGDKNEPNKWIMKIRNDGIFFNREVYSEATPDAFAQAVITILEQNFEVKFQKKEPSHDISP